MGYPLKQISGVVCLLLAAGASRTVAETHPLPAEQREAMLAEFKMTIARVDKLEVAESAGTDEYSRRGDAHFFVGNFDKAVADYDRMVELDGNLDASHWRRGIAWFYAGQFDKAAGQFERYHTFDNVDRENGIWRFFSQCKATSVKQARANLLKYEKTDRPPFPLLYRLFAGELTGEQVLMQIQDADISDDERASRLFYAQLYVGLDHAVHDRPQQAREHLAKAVASKWPQTAGYGPRYMWHVGRVEYNRLVAAELAKPPAKEAAAKPEPARERKDSEG